MDANGTRFHLLLTEDDWGRSTGGAGKLGWNKERNELTLRPSLFQFTPSAKDKPPVFGDRRGAARDRFGNWYWIGEDETEILVFSSGSQKTSHFWSKGDGLECAGQEDTGQFRSVIEAGEDRLLPLRGLTVTDDHYLVVGTLDPAGLLIFDLHSGGSPTHQIWPEAAGFKPFDMAPRPGGGVWILDRVETSGQARYWAVDRYFNVIARDQYEATIAGEHEETFRAITESEPRRTPPLVFPAGISLDAASPLTSIDAIAIESLPDGTVLILDRNQGNDFSLIYRFDFGTQLGDPVSVGSIKDLIESGKKDAFTLTAHDFAFVPASLDSSIATGRVYVAGTDGNQAYAFHTGLSDEQLVLEPIEEFFPMRLFGGKGVVRAGLQAYYDFDEIWLPLVEQRRPRYESEATFCTPIFDGKDPRCIWHRLMLDACVPSDTAVTIRSRAADREDDLENTEWQEEPRLYLRGDGPELPFAAAGKQAEGNGTWELLFQRACGRFLQLEIKLTGNGRTTPRVRALRAYYPRFSYLEHYLPAVYREDSESASFLDRFLANPEGLFTGLEDKIASVHMLFDVRSAPAETLEWLANWFGIALDPAWDEQRRRLFIQHAIEFFQYRGTIHGLQTALGLAFGSCIDETVFKNPPPPNTPPNPIRIVEKFRTRSTPAIVFGDPSELETGPRSVTASESWQPVRGGEELSRLYREALNLAPGVTFPLLPPNGHTKDWEDFSKTTLGFVPSVSVLERNQWSRYLQGRYLEIAALNSAYGTSWPGFDAVPFPADMPYTEPALPDWRDFAEKDLSAATAWRKRWQSFLSRRYRTVAKMNASFLTGWTSFDVVPVPDVLPHDGAPLIDWYQFEGVVLPMHASAHRFTVMLPVAKADRLNRQKQLDQLDLAYRILDLEKPAHTACDVRFYWAMFRIGAIRLGDGIPIDVGSRAPELLPPMVLGSGYLAGSYLANPSLTSDFPISKQGLLERK